jgi:uncharacterized protein (UPF0210 family)
VLDQATQQAIADLDTRLNLVEGLETGGFVVSQRVINEIIKSKISDIKINRISYDADLTAGKKISIYGTASSRERLLLFRQALEDNPFFQNVNLPISNFVKGADISFSLTLVPTPEK